MKKVIVLAAVAVFSLFGVSGAFAQTLGTPVSQNIPLQADVSPTCSLSTGAAAANTVTIPISGNAIGSTTAIPATGVGTVTCNLKATFSLSTLNGGVTRPGSPPSGSLGRIDYSADLVVAGVGAIANLTTNGTAGASTAQTAAGLITDGSLANTALTVSVTPILDVSGNPLAVGHYVDTLTVTITPST